MIAALLSDLWPILAGGVVAIVALLTGWARHKQAQTTEAQARQKEAETDKRVAQAQAIEAKANEDAARAGADNAKVRRDEDSAAAGEPDANRMLHDEWGK